MPQIISGTIIFYHILILVSHSQVGPEKIDPLGAGNYFVIVNSNLNPLEPALVMWFFDTHN